MSISRRNILLAGLGLAISGCASKKSSLSTSADRPGAIWPHDVKSPSRAPGPPGSPGGNANMGYHTSASRAISPAPTAANSFADAPVAGVIPRANWTRHGLSGRNVQLMNGVNKLTIHHEGWTPVAFTSANAAYDRIEKIRQIHTRDRGWADIGYHYIIDRAGRVIEGRPIRYQGAHVSENNPHNLGILVLGNFEEQKPSNVQVQALGKFARLMMSIHRVTPGRVFTHREINPTACPGRNLQAHVNLLRRNGTIA